MTSHNKDLEKRGSHPAFGGLIGGGIVSGIDSERGCILAMFATESRELGKRVDGDYLHDMHRSLEDEAFGWTFGVEVRLNWFETSV